MGGIGMTRHLDKAILALGVDMSGDMHASGHLFMSLRAGLGALHVVLAGRVQRFAVVIQDLVNVARQPVLRALVEFTS